MQAIVATWKLFTSTCCRDFRRLWRQVRSAVCGVETFSASSAWTVRFSSTSRRLLPSAWFSGIDCCRSRLSTFRGTTSSWRRVPHGVSNATGRLFYPYPSFRVTCQWTPAGVYRDNVAAMYQIAVSSFGIVCEPRGRMKRYIAMSLESRNSMMREKFLIFKDRLNIWRYVKRNIITYP